MTDIKQTLIDKGVIMLAPDAVVIDSAIDPDQIEPGVELFPGCVIRGARTHIGAGSRLGMSGGGLYENIAVGRGVELYGGVFKDAVFLDGVVVRGNAEIRGGTLMEEGSEVAHHVGLKMTITLPDVVMGSLVNFCDALIAGGTSRKDHTEVGSCLALYNFTPWGDKFASLFGDVPNGVFLRSRRIFVGGQTQIVSPVHVGYGALVPAGCAVRRSVPAGRMVGHASLTVDTTFDHELYGGLGPKFALTRQYIGNLRALQAWYQQVRVPLASGDRLLEACYQAALTQIGAGIKERIKRLDKLVAKLPRSLELHQTHLAAADCTNPAMHQKRIAEHQRIINAWPKLKARLEAQSTVPDDALGAIGAALRAHKAQHPSDWSWQKAIGALSDGLVQEGIASLQAVVDEAAQDPGQ